MSVFSMADQGQEPGYYRAKAAHMHKLADQALNERTRATYLRLEASWLRLAEVPNDSPKADEMAWENVSGEEQRKR